MLPGGDQIKGISDQIIGHVMNLVGKHRIEISLGLWNKMVHWLVCIIHIRLVTEKCTLNSNTIMIHWIESLVPCDYMSFFLFYSIWFMVTQCQYKYNGYDAGRNTIIKYQNIQSTCYWTCEMDHLHDDQLMNHSILVIQTQQS